MVFHFGEFARIFQSFKNFSTCFDSNSIGSKEVFKFCLDNNIKLIYSATSATLGNKGNDKNLSPYAFTKSKNLELLENLKKWFNLKFEIIYFYNVYGDKQIKTGDMATVIGIFEHLYEKKKPLTIVRPELRLEDLHIFLIQLRFAMMHGKQTNVHIIVFLTENLIPSKKLLKCLIVM